MSTLLPLNAEMRDFAGREITFGEVGQKLRRKFVREAENNVMAELIAGANDIRNDIIQSMRNTPKSGKLYSKGYKNKKGKTVTHRASSPGNPPAVDTGDLLRSIIMDARFTEVEVGSIITNPAYPKFLEYGSPKHKLEARPWLKPAVDRNEPRIQKAVRDAINSVIAEMRQ
jgi:hypothetical protein